MLIGTQTNEKHKQRLITHIRQALRQVSVSSAVIGLLFIGLLLYLSYPLIWLLQAPKTAEVETYIDQTSFPLQTILIREEILIPYGGMGTAAVITDGQVVAAGTTIALQGHQKIIAPTSGLYLQNTDGFEYLTSDMLSDLSVRKLRQLQQSQPADRPNRGKLVENEWYLTALAEADCISLLQEGKLISLTAHTDPPLNLTASVVQISAEENGICAVVFRCIDYLQQTAHLRQLTVTVNGNNTQGLCVPTEAVYTDETGSFVYVSSASKAKKQYITILFEKDGVTVLSQENSAHALHEGDIIILSAPNG